MKKDFFSNLNTQLWQLPEAVHLITWAVLITAYAHLFYGAWIERSKLKPHARYYMLVRCAIGIGYLCIKSSDKNYGMFDLFLPIYILFYIDGLITLKGLSFHRCANAWEALKRITQFQSKIKKA